MTADEFVVVGRIAGAFGVRGELKCDPTSAGRTVICAGEMLRCVQHGEARAIRVDAVRPHKGRLLVRIDGVDDGGAAEALLGALLYAPRAAIALDDGEFLDDDLVGCSVVGRDGSAYGTVERVEHFPASDMLVVNGAMVPMVRAIVAEIDLPSRRIFIDPPEGLLEPIGSSEP
ncbi:MAG: ribosome maturation factor RimM [Candidatus Cybelea sp.]